MKTLASLDVKNKRVLVRVDFNAPVTNGKVMDDFRISAYIPTIRYVQSHGGSIILISHLGRPDGKKIAEYSLKPIVARLQELLGSPVRFVEDTIGAKAISAIDGLKPGSVLMLENLRFHSGEEANDQEFAHSLSKLADVYVNDAFSVSHRAHASIVGIPKLLPSAAGLLLEKEIKELGRIRDNAQEPLVLVMGGAKVKTKIHVVRTLLQRVQAVCLGGVFANTILSARGFTIGKSVYEAEVEEEAKQLVLTDHKLHLPLDAVISVDSTGNAPARIGGVGSIRGDEMILDIGPDTIRLFTDILRAAKTIVWNGPLGFFEVERFAEGTYALAREFKSLDAYTVVGGGDVIRAVDAVGLLAHINFVSTGGGAMLEYLAGEKLPGVEALE